MEEKNLMHCMLLVVVHSIYKPKSCAKHEKKWKIEFNVFKLTEIIHNTETHNKQVLNHNHTFEEKQNLLQGIAYTHK